MRTLGPPLGPSGILIAAAWFALVTSSAELVLVGIIKIALGRYLHYAGAHLVWMSPLAALTVFAIPAGIMALLAWWRPGTVTLRAAVTVYAFLFALSVLFFQWHRLHGWAILLLGAGLAVQAGRTVEARASTFVRMVRLTMPVLAALLLLGIAGSKASLHWAERRALSRLPEAISGSPSVILLILDTVRASKLSLYGYDRATTPNLQRLARRGVRFDWAFSTAPWTLPAHASILTGRLPHEVSANWLRPLDATHPTLAEALSARGYLTGGFVANTAYCSRESGLDRGFAHYEDFPFTLGYMFYSSSLVRNVSKISRLRHMLGYHEMLGRKGAEDVSSEFLQWLSRNESGRPFFAFLNFMDAHAPYLPPPPFNTRFGPGRQRNPLLIEEANKTLDPSDPVAGRYLQGEVDAYDGALAYLDHQIGQLLDELEQRGVLRNAIVILTSDHGEAFGEHGHIGHSREMHTPALHVPLVIAFPGHIPSDVTVSQQVSIRDIAATVTALLGIDSETAFPGKSLGRFWEVGGASVSADTVLSSEENMVSLVTDQHHFLTNADGTEQLFEYRADPIEQHDLLGTGTGVEIAEGLRVSLPPALVRDTLVRSQRK